MEHKLKMDSIYCDNYLVVKFQNELKEIEQQLCIEEILKKINQICNCCRNYGYKALTEIYDEIDNDFLKDLIYLLSKADNYDEILYVIYLVKPRLYNYKYKGQKFVESVIYYEAMLMILEGEMPELVKIRISSILNTDESAKELLN